MAWNRYEDEHRSRGYGDPDYDRYSRSEPRDRGMIERGTDEVRSWFGDEEAEQRRRRESARRDSRDYRDSRSARGRSDPPGAGDYGYSGTPPMPRSSRAEWRDIDSGEENDYETAGRGPAGRSSARYIPATFSYTEIWAIPGPYVGRGPRGYQRSDERIREDVCERLAQHGMIDAGNIEVTVENGEVILRGTVEDRQMKRRAEDTAESVSGVSDVRNEIRVGSQESNAGHQSRQDRPEDSKAGADQSGRQKARATS